MTKNVVITRKVNAKTNFTPTREFYSVLVDGKDPNVGALPNTSLIDIVEAVLRRLKEVAINSESEAFDVNITLPLPISDIVKTFIKDKYELEPQFSSVTFAN
ncbi:hypothetical protein ABEX30_20365 [Priestia aryabhattai]|uniref:hypothetical protein n=1 Tax=Priestia aryabhattai TaxID=412384 RepID=UPI003D27E25F